MQHYNKLSEYNQAEQSKKSKDANQKALGFYQMGRYYYMGAAFEWEIDHTELSSTIITYT